MSDDDSQQRLELYRLYLATAERVSDRRAAANTWMLSVNAAVIGLYGYLGGDRALVPPADRWLWFLAVPAVGLLLCLAWAELLASYRKLNAAKFAVLHELEEGLPYPVFKREQEIYRAAGRRPFGLGRNRHPPPLPRPLRWPAGSAPHHRTTGRVVPPPSPWHQSFKTPSHAMARRCV